MTATQERLAKKQKVDAGLTIARTELAKIRCHREAMAIAERREQLIEKRLVERQAAYLLVALRQAILNVPQTWCCRLMGLNDAAQVSRILREMAFSILGEIKDLPAKVTNPRWLEEIDQPFEQDTKSKRGK